MIRPIKRYLVEKMGYQKVEKHFQKYSLKRIFENFNLGNNERLLLGILKYNYLLKWNFFVKTKI